MITSGWFLSLSGTNARPDRRPTKCTNDLIYLSQISLRYIFRYAFFDPAAENITMRIIHEDLHFVLPKIFEMLGIRDRDGSKYALLQKNCLRCIDQKSFLFFTSLKTHSLFSIQGCRSHFFYYEKRYPFANVKFFDI